MTRLGWLLVGGVGAVLLATVGLEATAEFDDGAPRADFVGVPSSDQRARPAARAAAVLPAVAGTDETDEQVAAILARPLFSRDRRPADAPAMLAATAATLPRLTGIVIGPGGPRAFFAGTGAGGRATVVAEGGLLGPFRVVSIVPGAVRVEGPGEPQILHPSFGPPAADVPMTLDPAVLPAAAPLPGQLPAGFPLMGRFRPGPNGQPVRMPRDQAVPLPADPGEPRGPQPGNQPGPTPGGDPAAPPQ